MTLNSDFYPKNKHVNWKVACLQFVWKKRWEFERARESKIIYHRCDFFQSSSPIRFRIKNRSYEKKSGVCLS